MIEKTQNPRNRYGEEIPQGYVEDSAGRLVRADAVRPQDALRDDLVRQIVGQAKAMAGSLQSWREKVLGEVDSFVSLVAEKYGQRIKRGASVTLNSYDGKLRVVVASADHVTFNEGLAVAKEMIWKCVDRWTEGSRSEIRAIVDAAFKTSRNGKLSTTKVLALKQVDIDDEEWIAAMEALTDSLQVVGSAIYVRCYERIGSSDMYRQITLDVFPRGEVDQADGGDPVDEGKKKGGGK